MKQNTHWNVLLIKHRSGHWAFPKGHSEGHETSEQTAERELKEESALTVRRYWKTDPFIERYRFSRNGYTVEKTVVYFLAEVTGEVQLQLQEVVEYLWIPVDKAHEIATFAETKEICRKMERAILDADI